MTLPEGSLLGLYTDGLVESRRLGIDVGLDMLCGALNTPGDSLETLCDRAVAALLPDRPADDAALFLVRSRRLDAGRVAVWDIQPEPAAVA